ncbi:hypothetical protein Csp2054_13930 [Curtobacterium sp. 'Ferrero']|uniref:hypothetical protein n=1 Tax=Curtobacterium sp. 'Ferrero' TaxID=2033654 RepID=UPI000BC415CD|nr:hypothetical protein [Curtobacterium sp. 'Ferrero']PCN47079.1 hypothetical protein Csp2054_13930 [Curtobacterium sp. 'Ferrero']
MAAVVVLLVVVDVVLVAMAMARTAPGSFGTPGPVPTFGRTDTATPSATPDASASAQAAATASARRLLSAVAGREAWRASSATCSDAQVVLEHTVDGGATWSPVAVGDDVRALWGMRATTAGLSVLEGVGEGCTQQERTSTDGGATWKDATPGASGAAITPAGVRLGSTVVENPCPEPVDAFAGDRTSVVVCDGQLEWRTRGSAWVDVPLGGVRGIAVDGDTYTLARIGTSSCDGVQIETMPAMDVSPATRTTPIGCNDVTTDGPIAIDRVGDTVWMWAGSDVAVSANGGATW